MASISNNPSPEVKSILIRTHDLTTALSNEPLSVAGILLSKELICREIHSKMLIDSYTPAKKAAILVEAVTNTIEIAPLKFTELLVALSEHVCTNEVVEKLRSTHQNLEQQSRDQSCEPVQTNLKSLFTEEGQTSIVSEASKPTLSPETKEDLCQRIHNDIKRMRDKFSKLQTMIRKNIKNNTDHKDFVAHLTGMYMLSEEHETQVAIASTIDEIFYILPKYWSFLDFSNLENIAETFCSNECEAKKDLDQYKYDVQQFCRRSVSEFPPGSLNNGADNEGMDKLIVTLDLKDPSLKHVQGLKEVIANILGQPSSKLVLYDVGTGSVVVTFLIASSLGEKLFLETTGTAKSLTHEQKDQLLKANVVSLEFKEITVFCIHKQLKKGQIESDPSDIKELEDIAGKIDNLKSQFDHLQKQIKYELSINEDISVEMIIHSLTTLPPTLKGECELIAKSMPTMGKEKQVNDLICLLNPLFSFMDFGLIELLIKRFGSDYLKKDMRCYHNKMKLFMKETTIKQLINQLHSQLEVPSKFSLIEAKIGQDASECTLEQVDVIKKQYCSELHLSEMMLHLNAVADLKFNSFIVKWLISSDIIPTIMKFTRAMKLNFFDEHKITSLTLDGMWLHMSEVEIAAMWQQVNDTKINNCFRLIHKQIVFEIKAEELSVEELCHCLTDQQPNLSEAAGICVSKAFMDMDPYPPCFADYEILNIFVQEFGSVLLKKKMRLYHTYMSEFVKYSSAQELANLQTASTEYHTNFLKVEYRVLKNPSDYTLDDICSLQNAVCIETHFNKFLFAMNNIRIPLSDSFSISWLIHISFASDFMESANRISDAFYARNCLVSLSIGNQWVYNQVFFQVSGELQSHYKQCEGSPSPLEWIPSPTKKIFRLAMIDRKISLKQAFIRDRFVQMTISGREDDILYDKSPVELENIFRSKVRGGEIILIEGAPGSGKSTLTVHICQRWGKGELFQQFIVVIFVQLRDPIVHNQQLILADLLPINNVLAQSFATEVEANNGRGVLWILDGWDELPSQFQHHSIFHELIDKKLRECSVIVTSRPISSGDLHPVVSSRIEVLGFTPEEQRHYFTECLKEDKCLKEALLDKIQENPVIQTVCYLPLNAAFVVHTFKHKGQSLPNTEYEIYLTVILSCIQRHFEREGRNHDLPRDLASLDDLSRSEAVSKPFQCLCKLAYGGVIENRMTFSSKRLPEGSNTLSLLQAAESFLQNKKSVYYTFFHLSVQELLSAYYMATWLPEDEQVSRFQRLFNQPRFAAVFQFYAAITKLKSPGIRQVIVTIIEAKSKPLLVSLLRCLHEAQDISLCLYVARRLKHVLNLTETSLRPLNCLSISFFLFSAIGNDVCVKLCRCHIDNLGAKFLMKYLNNDIDHISGITIDLSDNEIYEEGASCIARMPHFTEHLYLSFNPIGDTGVSSVSESIRESATIKTIILHSCDITSRGAEDLSEALAHNCSLKKLDISNNPLKDEGIRHIAEGLKQNTHLKELWIGDCGMTDKGAASLASALSVNSSLNMLHMGGSTGTVSENGLLVIAQSLTNFVTLVISSRFHSIINRLRWRVSQARRKNGLPPIEIKATGLTSLAVSSKH